MIHGTRYDTLVSHYRRTVLSNTIISSITLPLLYTRQSWQCVYPPLPTTPITQIRYYRVMVTHQTTYYKENSYHLATPDRCTNSHGTHDLCWYNNARPDVDPDGSCPRAAEPEQYAATKQENPPAESSHVEWRQSIAKNKQSAAHDRL